MLKENEGIIKVPIFIKLMAWMLDREDLIISDAQYNLNVTYSHLHNLKDELVLRGFLEETKQGRRQNLKLTNKGKLLAKYSKKLIEVL